LHQVGQPGETHRSRADHDAAQQEYRAPLPPRGGNPDKSLAVIGSAVFHGLMLFAVVIDAVLGWGACGCKALDVAEHAANCSGCDLGLPV
jgi:hypothetical protein